MRTFRTLLGTVTLSSPRLYHCRCQRRKTTTFRPLTALATSMAEIRNLFKASDTTLRRIAAKYPAQT
jgi:hypothetical protein